jgi:RHS repeat-associated protein
MKDAYGLWVPLVIGLYLLTAAVWLAGSECRTRALRNLFRRFVARPVAETALIAVLVLAAMHAGSTKPAGGTNGTPSSASVTNTAQWSPSSWSVAVSNRTTGTLTLYSHSLLSESSGAAAVTQRLTAAQYAARFALVGVRTNPPTWFSPLPNAVAYETWSRWRGVAEDTFFEKTNGWSFALGPDPVVDGAHVSSSGTLSFGWPKGSPRAAEMPDGTGLDFLAPLQGPFGIVPPAGRFWSAPTTNGSMVFTWENVFAGRDPDSPVTFQAELFPNGDFTYRYAFTNAPALTNFAIGAQRGGGGETYALNDTNKLVSGLELRWRAFGVLDPDSGDSDQDGVQDYDELTRYGTDPLMPDSDLDGLSDADEIAAGLNPLARCSNGSGMPDGANPQALPWSGADADANGLPDDWEAYWFGTNGTAGASADANGDGFSNLANLLTGTDPAAAPPPGFAVTNAVLADGLDAWEIAPAFALDIPAGMTNVLARTIPAARTSPWQQFFVSSKPGAAGAWALDGLALSWEAGTNSGASAASPSGDSLRLAPGPDLFASVSVRLDPSRASGLLRSPAPLYLVRWTPRPAFSGGTGFASATWTNGVRYVAAILESAGAEALPFTLDASARPQKAAPGEEEAAELSLPPDPGSEVLPVFAPGLAAGHLTAPCPSEAALPASGTNPPVRVLLYRPEIIAGGGAGTPLGRFSGPYPLDTPALRAKWRNNAAASGTLSADGFTVTTGIGSEALSVWINGEEAGSFAWPDGGGASGLMSLSSAAALSAAASSSSCDCKNGTLVQVRLCGGDAWSHCEDEDTYGCGTRDGCGCPDDTCDEKCECETCDKEGGSLGSLKFRIPLGSAGRDRISGFLWLALETPRAVTRSLFGILGDATVAASTNAGAVTVSCPAGGGRTLTLTDIAHGVGIRVGDGQDAPEHTWEIANPDGDTNAVRLVKRDPAGNRLTDETYVYAGGVWTRTGNLDGAAEMLTVNGDLETDAQRRETRSLASGGLTLSETVSCSEAVGEGGSAVARVTDEYVRDGLSGGYRHRHSVYWSDGLNAKRNGLLRLRSGDGRGWEYHAHDSRGRELLSAGPLDGSACPALDSGGAVTNASGLAALQGLSCAAKAYGYAPDAAAGDTDDPEDSRGPRTVTGYIVRGGAAAAVSREWKVYVRGATNGAGTLAVRAVRAAAASAAFSDAANSASLSVAYAGPEDATVPAALWNLPLREESGDGAVRTWAYELTGYDGVNGTLTVTERSGTTANPDGVPGLSTYTVETRDAAYGLVLRRETRLYTGAGDGPLLSWEQSGYDAKGHLLGTSYSDGTSLSNIWDCCRLQASVARDGARTEYDTVPGDGHWSRVSEASLGGLPGADGRFPAAETFTDALGRETNSVRAVMSNGSRDAAYAPQETRTAYPYGTDGCSVATDPLGIETVTRSTYKDNAKITETASGGVTNRTTETFGGATVEEKFWDGKWTRETRSTAYGADGCRVETVLAESSDYPAVTKSVTAYDFLGRAVSVTTPLGVTSNVYDGASSRLLRVSRTGSPDTLYAYDALGSVSATALDVDGDGLITYSGSDRINSTVTRYEDDTNGWWRVTSSAVWNQTGVDAALTSSVTRVRMTGLGGAAPGFVSASAVLTAQTESLDWRGNVTRSTTYTDAGSAAVWTVTETPGSVLPAIQKSVAGRTVSVVSSTAVTNSYTYDGFARQTSDTDGRGNTSVSHYGDLGLVEYTEDAASNRTVYAYDALGRRTAVTDPLTNTVFTAYDSLGNVTAQWEGTYPVAYGYDTAGRKVAMGTYRGTAEITDYAGFQALLSSFDKTSWLYDQPTGLLTNKVYADGSRVTYTYTTTGRLASRLWARGVTTAYAYDALGQLAGVTYSGATPDVSFGYDRLGRTVSAVTAASTNLFAYSGLALVTETQNGETLTRNRDALGRSAGFGLADGHAVSCGYDPFGRFSSVQAASSADTNLFRYAYLAGAGLVGSMTNSVGFWWRRTYEQNRDLIASVENAFGGNPICDFAYVNDAGGRRTRRIDSGSVTNLFGHNVRSEVVSAVMAVNVCDYAYDGIGNRTVSAVNAVTNTYTANSLNQYTAITGGLVASPTYDSDGNMIWDGHFVHIWDGENRLSRSEPGLLATNGAIGVENKFDYLNRRVVKTVRRLSGRGAGYPMDPRQPGTWNTIRTHRYVWVGWNIAAEITVDANAGTTNVTRYVWGTDLSGSMQGAGGVGGLLAVIEGDGSICFPCYDANGNITDYVDATGSVVAHREFGPFGSTTVASGPLVHDLHFWFSTKYLDEETGLYYYGYRFYSSKLGCWRSRDPIYENSNLTLRKLPYCYFNEIDINNDYIFVINRPIDQFDVLGLKNVFCNCPYNGGNTFISGDTIGSIIEHKECACKNVGTSVKQKLSAQCMDYAGYGEIFESYCNKRSCSLTSEYVCKQFGKHFSWVYVRSELKECAK